MREAQQLTAITDAALALIRAHEQKLDQEAKEAAAAKAKEAPKEDDKPEEVPEPTAEQVANLKVGGYRLFYHLLVLAASCGR